MSRLAFLLAAMAFAPPALAQDEHHEHHEHHAPPAQTPAEDPHAHHAMPTADTGAAAPGQEDDPHAGHAVEPDPHAGHDMGDTSAGPPVAPPGPAAFSGPAHAADIVFGEGAMARARMELHREHGAAPAYAVMVDRLEAHVRDGRDTYVVDAQAWYGGDIDKLWLKLEAHGDFGGEFEGTELQALWSHAIDPFFDLQTGVRLDAGPGPERAHFALGVQGLAPYWVEMDAAVFVSDKGNVTGAIEAEHDARITQRLILQPRLEAQFALQDIPSLQVGSGLSELSAGARLRYQVTPLLAPYVGLEYERALGDTRRLRRLEGDDVGGLSLVAGIRFAF
jgi:copper resistance protein B